MVQCNGAAVPLEDESAVTDKYQRNNVISAKLEHASAVPRTLRKRIPTHWHY